MKAHLTDISIDGNRLSSESERTLDQLLAGITKNNIHPEVDTGTPPGRELL
jgi:hypothetical protein